jgi:hypothetical protein
MIRERVPILLLVLTLTALPQAAAPECTTAANPYFFILFDTSSATNWSPPCTGDDVSQGLCSFACSTGDCFVPLQADDPASKLFQMKQALYDMVSGLEGIPMGFATYSQDDLWVRHKHWLYEASNAGGVIPGWGPFPAAGSREVFGHLWKCDNGTGDLEIGCRAPVPADLSDAWERGRVQRRPKGGTGFEKTIAFFVRHDALTYEIQYEPASEGRAGDASLEVLTRISRCGNASCSNKLLVAQNIVTWQLVEQFLSWDEAGDPPTRQDPQLSYYTNVASDSSAVNTCAGWEPNGDDALDAHDGCNLRWLTDASDSRGPAFSTGDVIPLDWLNDHKADVLGRLAPNVSLDPGAAPDFRISPYFRDRRRQEETTLRLRNELARPLIPAGQNPLGNSLRSFRDWYTQWRTVASAQDPDFACRNKVLLVLSARGDDACGGFDACTEAALLFRNLGVKTQGIGFGLPSPAPGNRVQCISANGGTGSGLFPRNLVELNGALEEVRNSLLVIFGPIEE